MPVEKGPKGFLSRQLITATDAQNRRQLERGATLMTAQKQAIVVHAPYPQVRQKYWCQRS
jgi:hypothetical protein